MALLKYKSYYINYIYSFTRNKIEKTYLFGKFFHHFFAFINYNKK